MEYTKAELEKMMERNGGSLDLGGCTGLTALPDNLTVGGWLDLRRCARLTALPDNLTVGGSLDLRGCTGLTALPDNLTVGGWLDLRRCTGLTALPDNLTVGGSLDLGGCTGLTALPDNLTVGDWLDLRGCTGLTALPDNLTVGGWLDLGGCTGLTALPDIYKLRKLKNGDYKAGRYLYADNILTHIKRVKKMGKYYYYIGKIRGKNVIFDGKHYAHCKSFSDGVKDIEFKNAKERGAKQYRQLKLSDTVTKDDAITMYRIITGACRAGTDGFVDSLGKTKDRYTIAEIIEITKGQYGAAVFENFFKEE